MCESFYGKERMNGRFTQDLSKIQTNKNQTKYIIIDGFSKDDKINEENTRIQDWKSFLNDNGIRKHIKGDDINNEEPVDGGKKSKKKKQDEEEAVEEPIQEEVEEIKDVPTAGEDAVGDDGVDAGGDAGESEAPPEPPPKKEEKKKEGKEFAGVGLSFYDSEDEDEEKKEKPMCHWQNYLDKHRWPPKKDEDDDENPPTSDRPASVSTVNLPIIASKPSTENNKMQNKSSSKTADDHSEHVIDSIARVTSYLEECLHCPVIAVSKKVCVDGYSYLCMNYFVYILNNQHTHMHTYTHPKQVAERVGLLWEEKSWSVDIGNRLLSLFNRLINMNKKSNPLSNEVIGQMLESFPSNQITHTVVSMLKSDLPLVVSRATHSYIQ